MKREIFIFLLVAFSFLATAQDFNWVKQIGGNQTDQASVIEIDKTGNIYVGGNFRSTCDFDPTTGTQTVTAIGDPDVFIAKYSSSGNLIWVGTWGQAGSSACGSYKLNEINQISSDDSGFVYVAGRLSGIVDVDPGPAIQNVDGHESDVFVSKFDSSGNFIWCKSFATSSPAVSCGGPYPVMDLLPGGGLVFGGVFYQNFDADPGATTYTINYQAGGYNAFLCQLDAGGQFQWARQLYSGGDFRTLDLQISNSADIYLMGLYTSTTDFDPGAGNFTLTPNLKGAYILKLSSAGNFKWVKEISANYNIEPREMELTNQNNLYISGNWSNGTIDLDPGPGLDTVIAGSNTKSFVAKLDSAGNHIWGKQFTSSSAAVVDYLATDKFDNCYLSGWFITDMDADPNAGIQIVNAQNGGTAVICKLNASGNFAWVYQGGQRGSDLIADTMQNIYATGYFSGAWNFNLNGTPSILNSGVSNFDINLLRIDHNPCANVVLNIDSVNKISCFNPGYASASVTGSTTGSFVWNTSPPVNSPSSVFNSGGIYSVTYSDSGGCIINRGVFIEAPSPTSQLDLSVNGIFQTFRPVLPSTILLDASNYSCDSASGSLYIILDSLVTFDSTITQPFYLSGDTLSWNYSVLNYDAPHITPQVYVTTSPSAQIGDTVCFEVFISPTAGDADTTNNYKKYCFPVVNGYDPNDISVYPQGVCPQNYVVNDQKLTYTIRFQNTGNSNAININVLDSLDSDLDLNSVRVIANSHPLITEVLPGNVLKFRFDNIMLPDSGSNEPASHGYVIYEVNPFPSLANGTQIKNQADIYFDFNVPVITNEVMNTIIDSLPNCSITTSVAGSKTDNSAIKVYPNPAREVLYVEGVEAGAAITIYDCSGRIILFQSAISKNVTIDMKSLENAVYILEVLNLHSRSVSKIILGN